MPGHGCGELSGSQTQVKFWTTKLSMNPWVKKQYFLAQPQKHIPLIAPVHQSKRPPKAKSQQTQHTKHFLQHTSSPQATPEQNLDNNVLSILLLEKIADKRWNEPV